jgi:hypothetical protein
MYINKIEEYHVIIGQLKEFALSQETEMQEHVTSDTLLSTHSEKHTV